MFFLAASQKWIVESKKHAINEKTIVPSSVISVLAFMLAHSNMF